MISVQDNEEFAEAPHLQCLYPFFSMSAVMVRVSHAHKNMDMAREHISLILELMVIFLSFQMTFSLVTAAVIRAILERLGSLIRYYNSQIYKLKLGTVSSFFLSMVLSVLMLLVLFVINWIAALICMPVEASSVHSLSTRSLFILLFTH